MSEFDIRYRPRTTINGQVVADFIAEFTHDEDKGAEESPLWSIYTDGSSNRLTGGADIVLLSPEGDEIECMVHLDFPATNNESEYEALIAGLDLAKAAGAVRVVVHYDSQVITNQVNGDYECKGERMKKYLDQVKARIDNLEARIVQIPRGENERVDRLAKAASAEHMVIPGNVLSFVQLSPLIDPSNVQEVCSNNSWIAPLVSYLRDEVLPDGNEAARKLKVQVARFILIKDVLYKRGFS